jgi:hypothetical protein
MVGMQLEKHSIKSFGILERFYFFYPLGILNVYDYPQKRQDEFCFRSINT